MMRMALILAAVVAVGAAHAYDFKQVAKAELDAEECRLRHADGSRLAELLTQRHCALLYELAETKRKAYEDQKRIERQRMAEDGGR